MRRYEVTVEFVTPCFLGGADSTTTAEWRAASIRGQLRWWFRAVAGGELNGDLKKVAAAEERLFGSTKRASRLRVRLIGATPLSVPAGGQCAYGGSGVLAANIGRTWGDSTTPTETRLELMRQGRPVRSNPIHYLGYGPIVWDRDRRQVCFSHARIEAAQKASFAVQLPSTIAAADHQLFSMALWAWLHLGGIGARSRRGWGSLCCWDVRGWDYDDLALPSLELEGFKSAVKSLLTKTGSGPAKVQSEWSHLSPNSAVFVGLRGQTSWECAMELVGSWLIGFRRRYGNTRDIRKISGISLVDRDYEWAAPNGTMRPPSAAKRTGASSSSTTEAPDRAGFGLPLPFGQDGETISWHVIRKRSSDQTIPDNRRASPLMIHIGRFLLDGREHYFPVFTHIPARLIPNGERLIFKSDPTTGYTVSLRHQCVVRDFLDDLEGKALIAEVR